MKNEESLGGGGDRRKGYVGRFSSPLGLSLEFPSGKGTDGSLEHPAERGAMYILWEWNDAISQEDDGNGNELSKSCQRASGTSCIRAASTDRIISVKGSLIVKPSQSYFE